MRDEGVPVDPERVPLDDLYVRNSAFRIPHSAFVCQPAVPFDGNDPQHAGRDRSRQVALSRPDLQHQVAGRGGEGVRDPGEEDAVREEMLSEPRPTRGGGQACGRPWRRRRR